MSRSNNLAATEPPLTGEQCREMGRLCLAHNLRRATRVISAHYDHAFKAAGLKSTQVSILATVRGMTDEGQVCRMGSLAKVMRMEVSTLTRNLAVLERDGLIVIDADKNDRRVRHVSLTRDGDTKLAQIYPVWCALQQTLTDYLEPETHALLLSLLAHLRRFDDQQSKLKKPVPAR